MSLCRFHQVARIQMGSFRQPGVLTREYQTRKLSTLPPTLRIHGRIPPLFPPRPSWRSYWWSAKATASPPEPLSPDALSPRTPLAQESTSPQLSTEAALEDPASILALGDPAMAEHPWVSSVSDVPSLSMPPPPLQLGDLKELGFCHLTPVGAVQTFLEFVQVTIGLPWWGTITLSTVLARLAILHFSIKTSRATARMAPVRPQMDVLMKEVSEAKAAGDQMRLQIAIMKLKKLRDDNGLGFGASMAGPLAQGVTSVSMFIAIKRLCDYPVEQLKHEGFGWLTSLTIADPYYILPALSVAIMNLQFYLGRAEMAAGGRHMLHFANGFRVLTVLFFPFVAHLPAGLLIHLVVNISLVAVQSAIMRHPAVRGALKIPPLPQMASGGFPTMRESWEAMRQWFRDQNMQATRKAQQNSRVPVFSAQSSSSPTPMRRHVKQVSRAKRS